MGLSAPGTGYGAQSVSSFSPGIIGSISFWIRANSLTGVQRFFGTGNDFEGRIDGTTFYNDFGNEGSGLNYTLSIGVLYHFVCTWNDFNNTAEMYVNGALINTNTSVNTPQSGLAALFSRYGTTNYFNGSLYDIRLYTRKLNASEALTIYNSRGSDSIVYGMTTRLTLFGGANGSTISGTGVVKNMGQSQINFSSASGAPSYVYDAALRPRRR